MRWHRLDGAVRIYDGASTVAVGDHDGAWALWGGQLAVRASTAGIDGWPRGRLGNAA